MDSHPTADSVYDAVRKEIPGISLGTVYRNLRLLAAKGELMAMESTGCLSRFDGCTEVHHHFRCDVCGRLFDIEEMLGSEIDREVEAQTGFKVRGHALEFRGICAECCGRGEAPLSDGDVGVSSRR